MISPCAKRSNGGTTVWQEISSFVIGLGTSAGLVSFWYYVMRGIGTF